MKYIEFLKNKVAVAKYAGFDVQNVNSALFPHQADTVKWCLKGGRRAVFASFGNGKTIMGLEIAHQCAKKTKKKNNIYDYQAHVRMVEELDKENRLPASFMVCAPASWSDRVWDDIVRMRTLNSEQSRRNLQMHVCPLQLDTVQRLITRYSNAGDTVHDFFGGIMTVPYVAVNMNRYGIGIELNSNYFRDGIGYLKSADVQKDAPTLFDFVGVS